MDEKDREIIRLMQKGFPLTPEPFKALGDNLWIDEATVISRLAKMKQDGVIRYFGTFFDSRKLGYKGTLAALNVEASRIDEVAAIINEFPMITHNYLREGTPNMWFTVLARDEKELQGIMSDIKTRGRVSEIQVFPSKRLFKVRTDIA